MSKLLYIITSADHGGAQQYVLTLAKAFNGSIAAGTEATWLFDEAKKQGIRTIPVKHLKRAISPLHDLLAIYELRKIIRAEKPDIVHLNSTKAGILGALAKKFIRVDSYSRIRDYSPFPKKTSSFQLTADSSRHSQSLPPTNQLTNQPSNSPSLLYTVHGFILNEPLSAPKRALYAFLERYCAKYRQHTIAVSEADRRAIITAGCGTEESVSVIPNGIAPIDFLDRKSARQQLNIADDVFAIGTIANLYKTKGLDVLINAFASLSVNYKLPSSFPDPSPQVTKQLSNQVTNLVILGSGPERKNLEKQISLANLSSVISLPGQIENAARLLKAFDIFVLPSRKEGMPFALLEAMQAGLPIIATKVGGVPEVLGDAGVLVESENPIKLAQAISNLVENRSEREKLAELAKEQAKKFSEEEMLAETKTIYERLLS